MGGKSNFAFRISLVDMIRKLRYRYEEPIDYLDNFIGEMYNSGEPIEIDVREEGISVTCLSEIDKRFIERIYSNELLTIASVMPPVADYNTVCLISGKDEIMVDEARKIRHRERDEGIEGLWLGIDRHLDNLEPEVERLKKMYGNSDISVSVNNEVLNCAAEDWFGFSEGDFSGKINYNPYSKGYIHFFKKGRFISSKENIDGLDVFLYNHPFETTITKSRTITEGKGKERFKELLEILPGLVVEYMESDEGKKIWSGSDMAYQTLIRSLLLQYPESEDALEYARENIIFFSDNGSKNQKNSLDAIKGNRRIHIPTSEMRFYKILTGEEWKPESANNRKDVECIHNSHNQECFTLENILGLKEAHACKGEDIIAMQGKLYVPEKLFLENNIISIAAMSVPFLEEKPKGRLKLYRKIAEYSRN